MNKLGFGFLRLPKIDENDDKSIDFPLLNKMVDSFLQKGGKYFDTAYTYLDGESEKALKTCLVKRHPRESFFIADKLPTWKVKSHQECYKYFEEQLNRCGVTYFDNYMLHWLNKEHYDICKKYDEFEFLKELKQQGKAKKIGFSYHDNAELLDKILSDHPEVDYVQLQINYLDWKSPSIEAEKCYEVAKKHNKQIIVMEPVKGGTLANLPEEADEIFKKIHPEKSTASWAIRFAQSLDQVEIVLSGMNSLEQIDDNMKYMPILNDIELKAIGDVCQIINNKTAIPCTGCSYCKNNCHQNISIPKYFDLYNEYYRYPEEDWKIKPIYDQISSINGKASDCIKCKSCENNCPQKIEITSWLEKVSKAFE